MKSRVKKMGQQPGAAHPRNRSPSRWASGDDSPVVLVLRGKELTLVPLERTRFKLPDLLPGISKRNLHGRISIGSHR